MVIISLGWLGVVRLALFLCVAGSSLMRVCVGGGGAWDSLAGAVCSMCLSYSFRVPYISHPFLGTSELAWNELVAMVKGQECKPSWLSVYQTSVCVISVNISLNKANDMTKLRIKWQGYIFYLFKRRYCKELWQSHTSRSKDWGY